MKKEIKKLIVSWLLNLAFKWCPEGEFKLEFAKFNVQHIEKL